MVIIFSENAHFERCWIPSSQTPAVSKESKEASTTESACWTGGESVAGRGISVFITVMGMVLVLPSTVELGMVEDDMVVSQS